MGKAQNSILKRMSSSSLTGLGATSTSSSAVQPLYEVTLPVALLVVVTSRATYLSSLMYSQFRRMRTPHPSLAS